MFLIDGTTLPHWHETNGFAGLLLSRSLKREKIILNVYVRNFLKENVDHVAGLAALITGKMQKNGSSNTYTHCMTKLKPKDVDEYIAGFPQQTQEILEQVRTIIKKIVPEAEETISYGIPTFNLNGTYLLYVGAYQKHIGVYPISSTIDQIDKKFAAYRTSGKGTVQFPLNEPMPLDLISKLVEFQVKENIERVAKKKLTKNTTKR